MKKRCLASLMTHQYKNLLVTMKKRMQFNGMPRSQIVYIERLHYIERTSGSTSL